MANEKRAAEDYMVENSGVTSGGVGHFNGEVGAPAQNRNTWKDFVAVMCPTGDELDE